MNITQQTMQWNLRTFTQHAGGEINKLTVSDPNVDQEKLRHVFEVARKNNRRLQPGFAFAVASAEQMPKKPSKDKDLLFIPDLSTTTQKPWEKAVSKSQPEFIAAPVDTNTKFRGYNQIAESDSIRLLQRDHSAPEKKWTSPRFILTMFLG